MAELKLKRRFGLAMSSSQASPIEKIPFLYLVIKSGVPSSSSASRACQARSMPEIVSLSKRKSSDVTVSRHSVEHGKRQPTPY